MEKTRTDFWEPAAVACAAAMAYLRVPLTDTTPLDLVLKPLLVQTSLTQDILVRAAQEGYFTLAFKALAHASVWLHSVAGLPLYWPAYGLGALLWIAQAALMFRLALDVSESREAAFLATIFIGAKLPLSMLDGPYNMAFLRYAIAMPAFLWGMRGFVKDRPWQALIGIGASTYLHATPAAYAWPLWAWEEARRAWGRPDERPRVLWRAGAALVIASPLLLAAASGGGVPLAPEFRLMEMRLRSHHIVPAFGDLAWADRVSMLEGVALTLLALWRAGTLRAAPLLWRCLGVWAALSIFGAVSYHALEAGWPLSRLWLASLPLQPADSRYWVDFVGQLALAAWLSREIIRGEAAALPALLLLGFSAYHDFVSRLAALALLACLFLERRRWAFWAAAASGAAPFLYSLAPGLFQNAAAAAGLKGGLFGLPFFHPGAGAALFALLVWGIWASPRARDDSWTVPSRLVAAAVLYMGITYLHRIPAVEIATERERMISWIRENTPPQALVMLSPLDALDNYHSGPRIGTGPVSCWNFVPAMERAVFACSYYLLSSAQFGSDSLAMAQRLEAVGLDFGKISTVRDYSLEMGRLDRELSPRKLRELSARWPITHLLRRGGQAWPGRELHREGELVLYETGGASP